MIHIIIMVRIHYPYKKSNIHNSKHHSRIMFTKSINARIVPTYITRCPREDRRGECKLPQLRVGLLADGAAGLHFVGYSSLGIIRHTLKLILATFCLVIHLSIGFLWLRIIFNRPKLN